MKTSAGREENGQVGLLLHRSNSTRLIARWTALPPSLNSISGETVVQFQPGFHENKLGKGSPANLSPDSDIEEVFHDGLYRD